MAHPEMNTPDLEATIEAAWDARDTLSPNTEGAQRDAVEEALLALDSGKARVAEKIDGTWVVHQWLKKATSTRKSFMNFQVLRNHVWPHKQAQRVVPSLGIPPNTDDNHSRSFVKRQTPAIIQYNVLQQVNP